MRGCTTALLLLPVIGSLLPVAGAEQGDPTPGQPCRILVLDRQNGWPVPLIELRTTHHLSWVTDNAGVVALNAHELMGQPTWLSVQGHGYEVAADGFGYRGVQVVPRPGETITLKVDRRLPAKRLGRITGAGLFAESEACGDREVSMSSRSLGCDSVQTARYRDRLHWIWGDTNLARYPLGRFQTTGATTSIRPLMPTDPRPPIRITFEPYVDDQDLPRDLAPIPGDGPTWLTGLTEIDDDTGTERLVATYSKIRPPMTEYECGLCVWDPDRSEFVSHRLLWRQSEQEPVPPPLPRGHAVRWEDGDGQSWLLFGDPFVSLACRADFGHWSNPDRWVTHQPQTHVKSQLANRMVEVHRGNIAWNDYLHCWVAIFTELGGNASHLGELWFARSQSPLGPWHDATHVVTHDQYTFYNPKLHADWSPTGSPILLFEATYTHTFSAATHPTPRYDYNQILYRLDLDELR